MRQPPTHKLSDVDRDALTATCAHCGPVKIKLRKPHKDSDVRYPCCKESINAQARKEYRANANRRTQRKSAERYMFNAARRRAADRGLEFNLTVADVVIPDRCPILGIELAVRQGKPGPSDSSPTLDRRDNSRGYTRDNVQVISSRANRIKSDATRDELLAIAAYMC